MYQIQSPTEFEVISNSKTLQWSSLYSLKVSRTWAPATKFHHKEAKHQNQKPGPVNKCKDSSSIISG